MATQEYHCPSCNDNWSCETDEVISLFPAIATCPPCMGAPDSMGPLPDGDDAA